jgi:NAD(P)H-flavin reductase
MTEILASARVDSLRLSCAKGEGLQFARLRPGRAIMVAGGTGINPFCDLIDLLFKEQLVRSTPALKNEVH